MSAVDTETERLLVENLRPAVAGRTVLVATQRLSTIGVADRAVVLEDGRDRRGGTATRAAAPRRRLHRALRRRGRCRVAARTGPASRGSAATRATSGAARVRRAARRRLRGGAGRRLAPRRGRDRQRHRTPATSDRLLLVVIAYVGVNAAAWVLGTATWRGLASIGQRVVLELRRDLFDHLTSLSLRYFSQQKAGWIIARLTSDVDALSDVLTQGLTTLVVNTLTLVAAVGGLFILDWRLGLVALLRAAARAPRHALVPAGHARGVRPTCGRGSRSSPPSSPSRSPGMAVVQAFNRERAFQAEFDELNDANRLANVRAQKIYSVFFPAIEFLGVVATVAVLFAGARADRRRHARDRHADRGGRPARSSSSSRCRSSPSSTARCRRRARRWTRSAPSSTPRSTSRDAPSARPLGRIDGRLELDRDHVRLRRRARPARHRDRRAAGRLHRARRRDRRRQVDDGEADRTLLRPRRGRRSRGRDGPPRRRAPQLPPPARRRPPGSVPLQRHDRRQHPLREARCLRRGGRRRRGGGRRRSGRSAGSKAGSSTSCARAARGSRPASAS